jgi:hypothetical protein
MSFERNGVHDCGKLQYRCFSVFGVTSPSQWARTSSFTRFLDHTQRHTKIGKTPLCEWSARCRDLYLTTHNTHNRQISMPPLVFEPTTSAGELQQTYAVRAPYTVKQICVTAYCTVLYNRQRVLQHTVLQHTCYPDRIGPSGKHFRVAIVLHIFNS